MLFIGDARRDDLFKKKDEEDFTNIEIRLNVYRGGDIRSTLDVLKKTQFILSGQKTSNKVANLD